MSGYIYYIIDGRRRVKIGYSKTPRVRISSFKTFDPLVDLVAMETGDLELERTRHKQFRREWIGGEWFAKSERLVDWIRMVNASTRVDQVMTFADDLAALGPPKVGGYVFDEYSQ